MFGLETPDFIALKTSCSMYVFCTELAERDRRQVFPEEVCEMNIIFLINVSSLEILVKDKPNFSKSFSEDVPFSAPVIDITELY